MQIVVMSGGVVVEEGSHEQVPESYNISTVRSYTSCYPCCILTNVKALINPASPLFVYLHIQFCQQNLLPLRADSSLSSPDAIALN